MQRTIVVLTCLAAAVALRPVAAQAPDEPVVVTLRASTTVDEPVVTVAALARVEGGPAWLRQKIGALDVAEVSAIGQTATVSRNQVVMRLRLAGIEPDSFRVEGPTQAVVQMVTVELTDVEVLKAAEKAVLLRLRANPGDLELRLLEDIRLPAVRINPGDQLRLRGECPPATLNAGKTRVTVIVLVNGVQRGVASVFLELCLYRHVAVTVRPLAAGQPLKAEDVRPERRLLAAGDQSVAYSEQLLGHRILHAVASGQVLAAPDLDLPLEADQVAIKCRDRVRLLASLGGLSAVAAGEALEDGKLGQVIRVRNVDSNKVVSGRVVGRSTVEVDY